jgi:hypothetical protein
MGDGLFILDKAVVVLCKIWPFKFIFNVTNSMREWEFFVDLLGSLGISFNF